MNPGKTQQANTLRVMLIFIAALSALFFLAMQQTILPFAFTALKQNIGGPPDQYYNFSSIIFAGSFISTALVILFGDLVNAKTLLIVLLFINILAAILLCFSSSFTVIAICQVLHELTISASIITVVRIGFLFLSRQTFIFYVSLIFSLEVFSSVIFEKGVRLTLKIINWHYLILPSIIFAIIPMIIIGVYANNKESKHQAIPKFNLKDYFKAMGNYRIWLCGLTMGLLTIFLQRFLADLAASYFYNSYHFSWPHSLLLISVFLTLFPVGYMIFGTLAAIFNIDRILLISVSFLSGILLLILAIFETAIPAALAIIICSLVAILSGITAMIYPRAAELAQKNTASFVFGIIGLFASLTSLHPASQFTFFGYAVCYIMAGFVVLVINSRIEWQSKLQQ